MKIFCPSCNTTLVISSHEAEKECSHCHFVVNLTQLNTEQQTGFLPVENDYTGEKIGDYVLKEVLGHGGMGTVYLASNGADGDVAVKVLSPLFSANKAFVKRFLRESEILRKLTHPHIVRFISSGQSGSIFYYAMEYIPGKSLEKYMASTKTDLPEKLRIASDICIAVSYAHSLGIIHRDIKPSNILIADEDRAVKLLDFGIANYAVSEENKTQLTTTNAVLGTYNYMSPEQRMGPSQVTERSDIYSLGVVFYQLFTGRLPMGAFLRPMEVDRRIPKSLDLLVMRCLHPDPNERFRNGFGCLTALRQSQADLEMKETLPLRRAKRVLLAASLLILCVLGGIQISDSFTFLRSSTDETRLASSTTSKMTPINDIAKKNVVQPEKGTTPPRILEESESPVNIPRSGVEETATDTILEDTDGAMKKVKDSLESGKSSRKTPDTKKKKPVPKTFTKKSPVLDTKTLGPYNRTKDKVKTSPESEK